MQNKIKQILIGTNNKGKFKEIKDLLPKVYDFLNSKFKIKVQKKMVKHSGKIH